MLQTLRMHSVTSSIPSYNQSISLTSSIDSTLSSEYSLSHTLFAETPLTALSQDTRRQLSKLLNSKKVLRSEEGYERDWRGIAALSKQKSLCDENSISADDPTSKVLSLWCVNNPQSATFANLERYLGIIDRWDVSDDINENLVKDSESFRAKRLQSISSVDESDSASYSGNNNFDIEFARGSDPNILTEDDVLNAQKGLPPQQYDAFVLFADSDIRYAIELIEKLEEDPVYNFKLCFKERDCLGGISFPHVKLSQLIEERCKHLIVILTADFLRSPENTFLVDYTQTQQIQYNTRKIIPLIYDSTIAIPKTLQIYTHLKYNKETTGLVNFWVKLASSIRNVNFPTEATVYTKERYNSITYPINNNNSSQPNQLHIQKPQLNSVPSIDLNQLPTPPTDIPSISINGHVLEADEGAEIPSKNERRKFKKRSSLRHSVENRSEMDVVATTLRNAHSTSQLSAPSSAYKTNNNSLSDLSTSSISSDSKKKKRWPSKILKKVFSRSSSKLQEPA